MNKVLEDILPLLLNHEDTSIQTLAKALQGNQGIVQKGAAQVSHWIVDRAYALDMPVVAIGDAVCPPNPWTGSGANLAIASVEPLGQLMDDLSSSNTEDVDRTAFKIFDQKTKPIRMQALLRGTFASQIFERNHAV